MDEKDTEKDRKIAVKITANHHHDGQPGNEWRPFNRSKNLRGIIEQDVFLPNSKSSVDINQKFYSSNLGDVGEQLGKKKERRARKSRSFVPNSMRVLRIQFRMWTRAR